MRELTKEQIEQVAGAGASSYSSYGSSWHDPSKHHKKHHHHHNNSYHKPSYDPYGPVTYNPTPYAPPYSTY